MQYNWIEIGNSDGCGASNCWQALWLVCCPSTLLFKQQLWKFPNLGIGEITFVRSKYTSERVFRDRGGSPHGEWWLAHQSLSACTTHYHGFTLHVWSSAKTRKQAVKPVLVQVLATFDIFATGTFRWEIGDRAGVSHLKISRVLPDVGAIKVLSSK